MILIGWFILRFTVFGRFIYAIGTNEEAVRLSGHTPRIYKMAAFTISGLTAGIAAMVYLLRLNVGSPIAGVGYELNAIAAVIIGGTSLSGGKGSIIGTLVGACILQVLTHRAAIVRRRRQRQADRHRHGHRAGGGARRLSRPVPARDRVALDADPSTPLSRSYVGRGLHFDPEARMKTRRSVLAPDRPGVSRARRLSREALSSFSPYDPAAVEKAIASGKPVVVHVYASWCLQCHMQASILDGLKSDPAYDHATYFRVDYDNQKDVVAKLDCPRSTLIAYKGGKEVARMSWGHEPGFGASTS